MNKSRSARGLYVIALFGKPVAVYECKVAQNSTILKIVFQGNLL